MPLGLDTRLSTVTWLSQLVDLWINGYGTQDFIPSNGYSLVMVWFWRCMVLSSCLLDVSNGYWSIWIGRCDLLNSLIIRWNLGDLGPCLPLGIIISGFRTV